MKSFLSNFWEALRGSYWFVPSVMTAAAIVLSYAFLALDRRLDFSALTGYAWIYAGGASGARSVLSTVASSVITVAGTTFSITIATLSLTSSQFGPRLLRGFLRDTGNQIVLGTFIGTFVYCLLILRTIRGDQTDVFVPNFSVTMGVFLALASVGVLIYFINHVSASIQASEVIKSVSVELNHAIDRLYPVTLGEGSGELTPSERDASALPSQKIVANRSGYIQSVDEDRLMALAQSVGGFLEIVNRPGAFATEGAPLARLHAAPPLPKDFCEMLNKAFTLGPNRTMTSDAGFGMDQLVEVASRALSPGINDPFTAISCLNRIGEALSRLATRPVPSACRYDDDGVLRIVACPLLFPEMVNSAFDPIRQYGSSSLAVTLHLLYVLDVVAAQANGEENREALRRQARLVHDGRSALSEPADREAVSERYARTMHSLSGPEPDENET
jgi:uncharacterized membrane protein